MSGSDPFERFPDFVAAVRQRLEAGREAYGDRSFDAPVPELLAELEQEALDLAGWGFVLYERLRRLQAATDGKPRVLQGDHVASGPMAGPDLADLNVRGAVRSAFRRPAPHKERGVVDPPNPIEPTDAPYADVFHGIPVTAEQRDELQRLAHTEGCITRELVLCVKAGSSERAAR